MPAQLPEERPGSLALGALVFGAGIGALATEMPPPLWDTMP